MGKDLHLHIEQQDADGSYKHVAYYSPSRWTAMDDFIDGTAKHSLCMRRCVSWRSRAARAALSSSWTFDELSLRSRISPHAKLAAAALPSVRNKCVYIL